MTRTGPKGIYRMKLESIARIAHEANRALQVETGDPAVSPHWDDAPSWQRESAVDGVRKAIDGATPEQLHQSWCEFKRADGWQSGKVKDADAKTHPCLVDYGNLPADQKLKDDVFSAVVSALASEVSA
ncbi:RyR domain-containing protein [Rhodococcus qingshengii]|uniref:RyR domain-containing protein n=1 Tax=Rhodococcus TaxID=1827 RepID=UPI001BA4AF16|nr:RyR domain-containing protein [Rhodococcus qingshengii]MBS3692601.1 hypothetical protein [Rhodococcus qingshengii]